jgi:hypothetical protein
MRARAATFDYSRPTAPPSPVQRPLPAPALPPKLQLPPSATSNTGWKVSTSYETDVPLSSSAPQLTTSAQLLLADTCEPVDFMLDGFDDNDKDEGVFQLEEDEDVDDLAFDGEWSWEGSAKLRHESSESYSTRASTPPGFLGSPVLHACLKELREKRELDAFVT